MSMRSTGPVDLGGEGLAGPLGFALLLGGGWVVWSLFELSIALALGAIAFVGVCVFLLIEVMREDRPSPLGEPQQLLVALLLGLAVLCALLIYPLSVEFHIVPFADAGWIAIGFFYASLIAGAWIAISALGRSLAMVAGAAVVAAMAVLPAPRGAADPADKDSEWKITLSVLDENGDPLEFAVAQCSSAMVWDGEGPATFDHGFPQVTAEDGKAHFTFHEDMRLKVAVCTALKEHDRVSLRPTEDDFARATYPPKSITMASPFPGGDYKLTLRLEPRKDSASSMLQR